MITVGPRRPSGIFLESNSAEAFGVLPGEERQVLEVMHRDVISFDAFTSVAMAVEHMREGGWSILVVCQDEEPMAALTEYELFIDGSDSEYGASHATLRDAIARRMAVRCREDAMITDVIRPMALYHMRHIPVLDANGKLVGVLSLMSALAALPANTAISWLTQLREFSEEAPKRRAK